MRHVRLIAACDEYDSKPGLIVKGTPNVEGMMADRNGTLIAHDLIEHQNGAANIGTVWDELEALGGIWHARGRWGDFESSMYSPAQNVAADLTRMFPEWASDPMPPRKHRLKQTRAHDHDDDFLEIIQHAREDIPKEYDPEDVDRDALEEYLTEALHRMRTGFRKASRRFGDRFASNNQWRAIRDAIEQETKHGELYEGQEFVLAYGDGKATVREFYYPEDY